MAKAKTLKPIPSSRAKRAARAARSATVAARTAKPAAEPVPPASVKTSTKPAARMAKKAIERVAAAAPVSAANPPPRAPVPPVPKPAIARASAAVEPAPAIVSEPLSPPVEPVVAAVTELFIETSNEGPDMATTSDTIKNNAAASTDRVEAILGDVNARTKTAIEKSTKFYEEMTEFTKGNVEALVASGRVVAKAAENLGQGAAEYSKRSFETASTTLRSFASAKSPTELFQLQSEFARTAFDSAVAESSKLSESLMKLAGEIAQPLSSRFALAAEKVKNTTR